jgi:chromate transporter
MHPPSLAQAFLYWLKLGCTSFGGPAGQIALMHQSLVHYKKWISEDRFLHALNFCILLPGPEAQQLAIYMGWLLHKTIGGLIAGILFILPAFFILCGLAYVYINYGELGLVRGFFAGVKPVIVALVLFAAFRMGIKTLNKRHLASISVLAFIGLFLTLPFPLILLMAGLSGLVMNRQSKLSKMLPSSALQDSTFFYPDWLQSLKTLTIGVMVIVGS